MGASTDSAPIRHPCRRMGVCTHGRRPWQRPRSAHEDARPNSNSSPPPKRGRPRVAPRRPACLPGSSRYRFGPLRAGRGRLAQALVRRATWPRVRRIARRAGGTRGAPRPRSRSRGGCSACGMPADRRRRGSAGCVARAPGARLVTRHLGFCGASRVGSSPSRRMSRSELASRSSWRSGSPSASSSSTSQPMSRSAVGPPCVRREIRNVAWGAVARSSRTCRSSQRSRSSCATGEQG